MADDEEREREVERDRVDFWATSYGDPDSPGYFGDEPPAPDPDPVPITAPAWDDDDAADEEAAPAWPLISSPAPRVEKKQGLPFYRLDARQQGIVVIQRGPQPPDSLWRFDNGYVVCCGRERELLSFVVGETERRPYAIKDIWVKDTKGIIAGRDKAAKSTHGCELMISLATGTPMWGLPQFPVISEPAPGFIIQTENADDLLRYNLRQILQARGISPDSILERRLFFMQQYEAINFSLLNDGDQDYLRQRAHEGYRYVLLDPLYELVGEADMSDRSGNVPGILAFLTELQTRGLTPIFTHASTGMSRDTLFGSKYFRKWIESALFVSWDDKKKLATINADRVRFGYGIETLPKLQGLGVGRWRLHTQVAPESSEPKRRSAAAKQHSMEQLATNLKSHPNWSIAQHANAILVEDEPINERTVERYLKEMSVNLPRDVAYPDREVG